MSEISELFDKDPLLLTKEDRSAIVAKLREDRQKFLLGNKRAGAVEKKAAPSGGLKLDDLDLKL